MKKPTPTPIPSAHKCSVCDLDWKRHGEKPTLEKCVELLKAECARLRNPNPLWMEVTGKPWSLESNLSVKGLNARG